MAKVIVVVAGPPVPELPGADVYLPVDEGVTGRDDPVAAVAIVDETKWSSPDGVEAYRVDERVQWDRGGVAVSRIAFVCRSPGTTREDFADHWTDVHAPLARRHHPTLRRYVQNVVVEPLTPDAPDVDGIAELGFRSLHDVHHRMYDSPAGAEIIRRDVRRFLDVAAGWRVLARPA